MPVNLSPKKAPRHANASYVHMCSIWAIDPKPSACIRRKRPVLTTVPDQEMTLERTDRREDCSSCCFQSDILTIVLLSDSCEAYLSRVANEKLEEVSTAPEDPLICSLRRSPAQPSCRQVTARHSAISSRRKSQGVLSVPETFFLVLPATSFPMPVLLPYGSIPCSG